MTTDSEKTPEVNMDWLLDALHDYYRHLLSPFDLVILVKKRLQAEREQVKELEAENDRLRGERCYICRPDDKKASEEGCADCEEKSDLNQSIIAAQERMKRLVEALEEIFGSCSDYKRGSKIAEKALKAFQEGGAV